MWYLYIIESEKDGIHYTGITKNIINRINEHNSGKNRFTKGHLPWKLISKEKYETAKQAREREKFIVNIEGIGLSMKS